VTFECKVPADLMYDSEPSSTDCGPSLAKRAGFSAAD
jgi:hypothetical protein